MYASEHRDADKSHNAGTDDEVIDAGLKTVRMALLSLPKVTTPAGFESRLMRRIHGVDVKSRVTERSWASGWIGVGLGFACAAVIALFAFDFGTQAPIATTGTTTPPIASSPVQVPSVNQPVQSLPETPVSAETGENFAGTTDSVSKQDDPNFQSKNLMQVSGEESGGK